jgi:hypothetical protein
LLLLLQLLLSCACTAFITSEQMGSVTCFLSPLLLLLLSVLMLLATAALLLLLLLSGSA